jgi:hypothetical protein
MANKNDWNYEISLAEERYKYNRDVIRPMQRTQEYAKQVQQQSTARNEANSARMNDEAQQTQEAAEFNRNMIRGSDDTFLLSFLRPATIGVVRTNRTNRKFSASCQNAPYRPPIPKTGLIFRLAPQARRVRRRSGWQRRAAPDRIDQKALGEHPQTRAPGSQG